MARKDYEIAFQLSAQLDRTFQAQFNTAGKNVELLQRKIDDINKLQSDIKGYEKQQSAIESTTQKLAKLQQEYEKLEAAKLKDGALDTETLAKLAAKQVQIDKTTASLDNQKQKLDKLDNSLQKAGVDTSNLKSEQERLDKETENLKSKQEEAAESVKNFGKEGVSAMQAFSQALTSLGIMEALQDISEQFMSCVNTAASFEETMSTVEALSGASSSEMEQLSTLAKDLGAATQYSAQESAEAMTYMAMAGWDTEDMLNGMSGVMDLAAASGEDLALVSDIVTDSMTAFGLTASDTAHYADVLAAAATNSNTDVAMMGETFQYCAPLAGALGYSVEDVATMVGLMANSGVKASNAGTALRTMFSQLSDGATLTAEAFGEYTIETQNADGTMRSLSDVVTDLRSAFSQMTEAEKVANAETLVGKNAMTGFVTLMNSTEDDFDSLSESINNCSGAAAEMSEIKLDNMNGELELTKSAWEGVTIAIGEGFTPVMSEAYGMAAEVFDTLKEFIEENPSLVKAIAAGAAAFGTLAAAVAAVSAAVAALNVIMANPVVLAFMAAAAAGGVLTAAIVGISEAANEGIESVSELTDNAQDLQDAMSEANDTYRETVVETQATAEVASLYIDKLEEIKEATDGNVQGNQEYSNILQLLCQQIPELTSYIDTETNSINGGIEALREYVDAWKENAETQAQQEYINSLMSEYSDVLTEQTENEIKLTEAKIKEQEASKKLETALERREELLAEAQKQADEYAEKTGLISDATAFLSKEYYELESEMREYSDEVEDAKKQQENLNAAIAEDAAAVAEAEQAITDAQNAIDAMNDSASDLTDEEQALAEEQTEVSNRIAETTNEITEMIEAYQEVYETAYKSVTGQYSLWDTAAEVTSTSAATINSAIESQITYWSSYNDNLAKLNERSDEIEGLSGVIASFADGSEDSVNAIAGMAAASDEELEEMVANYQELLNEQQAASEGIADLTTGYDEAMEEMAESLADDIDAMDLSDEAAQSGAATIQGYIDGIDSKSDELQTAAQNMLRIVQSALNGTQTASSTSSTWHNGIATSIISQKGYASGTDSATPGIHMVGEEGPELVAFNGGEQVLNAQQTKEVLETEQAAKSTGITQVREAAEAEQAAGPKETLADSTSYTGATAAGVSTAGNTSITYAPVINISGTSATQSELQTALEDAQEKFERWYQDYIHQQKRLSFA